MKSPTCVTPQINSDRGVLPNVRVLCLSVAFVLFGLILASLSFGQRRETNNPVIPRTWDTRALAAFQMRLADPNVSPKLIDSSYYYSIPVRPIYKSYAVYRP